MLCDLPNDAILVQQLFTVILKIIICFLLPPLFLRLCSPSKSPTHLLTHPLISSVLELDNLSIQNWKLHFSSPFLQHIVASFPLRCWYIVFLETSVKLICYSSVHYNWVFNPVTLNTIWCQTSNQAFFWSVFNFTKQFYICILLLFSLLSLPLPLHLSLLLVIIFA